MEPLYRLSLREMVAGVRERRFDAAALMRSCLARIEAREPQVQAWEHLDPERAMARAQAADGADAAHDTHGPLHGAPLAVKDELLDEGAAIGERGYGEALRATQKLRENFPALTSRFDAIITPPAPGEAPPTLQETGNPAFCTIWTLLGVPAITIPVSLGPAGLPLGLQIVGAHGEDDRTLGVAAWCEAHLPFAPLQ